MSMKKSEDSALILRNIRLTQAMLQRLNALKQVGYNESALVRRFVADGLDALEKTRR